MLKENIRNIYNKNYLQYLVNSNIIQAQV